MKITNKEQFNKFPNGTIFKLFLSGESWDEEFGDNPWVIKKDNKLYVIEKNNWFDFNECNINDGYDNDEYDIEVFYNKESDN